MFRYMFAFTVRLCLCLRLYLRLGIYISLCLSFNTFLLVRGALFHLQYPVYDIMRSLQ